MLNQLVLVGRMAKDCELKKTDKGKSVTHIFLAVPRSFKNINGEYETDFFDCTLWDNVAKNTSDYCHKGDVIGVKGRLQNSIIEKEGKKITNIQIIAEKITFLSSKKADE